MIAGAIAMGWGLSGSGRGQPASTEERVLTAPGGWTLRRPSCAIERRANDRNPTAINVEASYSFLPDIHYQIFLQNERWPIAITRESYVVDLGFDGAPPAIRNVEVPGSGWVGFVPFALDPGLRQHIRSARSLEIYRRGQRVGSVDLSGMSEALREFEACATAEAEAYMRDQEASANMQGPDGNMMEMNEGPDPD